MSNHKAYFQALVNKGIDPETAYNVASAAVATDEGRERTDEEQQACFDALMSLADDLDDDE